MENREHTGIRALGVMYIAYEYTSIPEFSEQLFFNLTLKVLVTTIDAQWEGMGDVGSARYEPALLPPCPTMRVVIYSN